MWKYTVTKIPSNKQIVEYSINNHNRQHAVERQQPPIQRRHRYLPFKIFITNEMYSLLFIILLFILCSLHDQSNCRSTGTCRKAFVITFVVTEAAQHNPYSTYQLYHSKCIIKTIQTHTTSKSQQFLKSTTLAIVKGIQKPIQHNRIWRSLMKSSAMHTDIDSCTAVSTSNKYHPSEEDDDDDYNSDYNSIALVSSKTAPWRANSDNNNRQNSRSTSIQQRRDEYYKTNERIIDYSYRILDVDDIKNDRRVQIYDPMNRKKRRTIRKNQQLSWTNKIIWITIGMYGLQILRPSITQYGMKLSNRILDGSQLYRLLTPIVLHGSIFHLMTNMVSLSRMGNDVEQLFGSSRYICTYVGAGIVGNYISALQSKNPSLGASGSVFGIVGSYFIFLNRNEWLLGNYGRSMTDSIIQTTIMNVFLGFMNPQIDQWAHLGGAIGGATISYLFGPRLYLLETGLSTTSSSVSSNIVIDRPILRVPKSIEELPKQINDSYVQISNQILSIINTLLPTNSIVGRNGSLPWQKRVNSKSSLQKQFNKHRLIDTSRSLEPGSVD